MNTGLQVAMTSDATWIDIGFEVSSLNSMISSGLVITSTNEQKKLVAHIRIRNGA